MPAVTVRNLTDETHRALRLRAAIHGRSTEAEIRAILDAAVRQGEQFHLGSALMAATRDIGGVTLPDIRDKTPALGADFS